MSIALIDFPDASTPSASALSFAMPGPLDNFDLVIWRPAALAEIYMTEGSSRGGPVVLRVRDSQRMYSDIRFWRAEFEEFLGRGGTLVVLAPGFTTLGLHTVQDIVPCDVIEALPRHRDLHHTACEASDVQCDVGEPFHGFFSAVGRHFVAKATFMPRTGQPIAHLAETNKICATYEYRHPGRVLVMPELRGTTTPPDSAVVVDALKDLSARLRLDARVSGVAGANPVITDEENALRQQLAEISRRRRTLQTEEAALLKKIAAAAFFGQLEHGDGIGVVNAAFHALHALGAYVQYGIGSTGTLMFEHRGDAYVLVLVDELDITSVERLQETLRQSILPWAKELNCPVSPVVLMAGVAARRIAQEAAALRAASTVPWLTGTALKQAYREKSADFWGTICKREAQDARGR